MSEPTIRGRLYLHMETGYEGPPWAFQDERFITKNNTTFSCAKCNLFWDKRQHKTESDLYAFWVDFYNKRLNDIRKSAEKRKSSKSEIRSLLVEEKKAAAECLNRYSDCSLQGGHTWQKTSEEHWSYDGLHILELGDRLKITKAGKIIFEGQLELESTNEYGVWWPKGFSKKEWAKLFNEPRWGDYILRVELTPVAPPNVKMAVHGLMPGYSLVQVTDYRESSGEKILNGGKAYLINVLWNFSSIREAVPLSLSFTPREFWCNSKDPHGERYCICKRLRSYSLAQVRIPGCDNSSLSCSGFKIPTRLQEAIRRYFPDDPVVESFKKDPVSSLFSFEANLTYFLKGRLVTLHFYLQDRTSICGCRHRRDKLGRWKRTSKKEERICICKDLPSDVLTSLNLV